jgi:hypothetical protein
MISTWSRSQLKEKKKRKRKRKAKKKAKAPQGVLLGDSSKIWISTVMGT